MPKMARELGALAVKRLTAPGFYPVGVVPGLALQVTPSGARSWILRAMVHGKRRDMGLGGYPAVALADAHRLAREAREKIAKGEDPLAERRMAADRARAEVAGALTFKRCAQGYIASHSAGWKSAKHAQQWTNTLETYAYPVLGDLLVRDVERPHVLAVLEPIWTTKTETATRLRSRLELVLSYAMQRGYRPEGLNPARWRGGLDKLLPPPNKVAKVVHHAALPVNEMPAFMTKLRAAGGMGARALEFAILTAGRSGEVRGATWAEIDLAAAAWLVPAARMKAGRAHRVPLSAPALALLRALPRGDDPAALIFPSTKDPAQALSDMTLSAVLRRLKAPAVPHGFRSTFRDWAAERTNYPNEVAEMALAHTIENKAEAAYRRGDMFERRAAMMAEWAAFIGGGAS